MRIVAYLARFVVMGAVVVWFLLVYAMGRLRLALTGGDPAARRAALDAHRGRVLRAALATLGCTFVKLGQVASTRPDLFPPEIIEELRALQDRLAPFSFARAARIVEADLGAPLDRHFAEF